MTYWFSADLHLRHTKVLRYCNRPFVDIEEHDRALLKNWNDCVKPTDTAYILGDFGFGNAEELLKLRRQMNGNIHLVRGNHDLRMPQEVLRTFASTHVYTVIRVPDAESHATQKIVLMHYKIQNWDSRAYGSWHLWAHAHGTIVDRDINLSMDVGVDAHNYKPVSYEQVRSVMVDRAFKLAKLKAKQEESGNEKEKNGT